MPFNLSTVDCTSSGGAAGVAPLIKSETDNGVTWLLLCTGACAPGSGAGAALGLLRLLFFSLVLPRLFFSLLLLFRLLLLSEEDDLLRLLLRESRLLRDFPILELLPSRLVPKLNAQQLNHKWLVPDAHGRNNPIIGSCRPTSYWDDNNYGSCRIFHNK